jgi:hypothetical protein
MSLDPHARRLPRGPPPEVNSADEQVERRHLVVGDHVLLGGRGRQRGGQGDLTATAERSGQQLRQAGLIRCGRPLSAKS